MAGDYWHCLQTFPQGGLDTQVCRELLSARVEAYQALRFVPKKIASTKHNVPVPEVRFSQYVFFRLRNEARDSAALEDVKGIARFLTHETEMGSGERVFSRIPERVIDGFKFDQQDDILSITASSKHRRKETTFHPGDLVRIVHDKLLAGYEGRVEDARVGSLSIKIGDIPWRFRDEEVVLLESAPREKKD